MSKTVTYTTGTAPEMVLSSPSAPSGVNKRDRPFLLGSQTTLEVFLQPPVVREQLQSLAQPGLDVIGERVGIVEAHPTVDAILATQATANWFPFVRAWNAELLESNERLLIQARQVSAYDGADIAALLQWRDTVMELAVMMRLALVATSSAMALPSLRAAIGTDAAFADILLALDRGELRSRHAVSERLQGVAGEIFRAVLLAEQSEAEISELEESIADPDGGALRLSRLKRHKKMLDTLAQQRAMIDLTIQNGDEEEERELVVYCQNRLRGFASQSGLNVRGTLKRATANQIQWQAKDVAKPKRSEKKQPRATEVNKEKNAASKKQKKDTSKRTAAEDKAGKDEEQDVEGEDGEDEEHGDDENCYEEEQNEDDEKPEERKENDFVEVIQRELFEASASTADVLDLLRMRTADGNLLLPQVGVADPNASTATAKHGAELMNDLPRVKMLLRNEWLSESGANRVSVQEWGQLLSWWRIVERAYAVHGIFEHFRSDKKKSGGRGQRTKRKNESVEKRWNQLVRRLRVTECVSFKQASHYDRIGAFLLDFPGFVWQTQIITIADWTRTFKDNSGARAKNFVTMLRQHMDEKQRAFWNSPDIIRADYARMRPSGKIEADGQLLHFRVIRTPGDGDCGYTVIGIPREEAADALIEAVNKDDEEGKKIRMMVGMEIRSMLDDENALPESVRDETVAKLLTERVELQSKIDELRRGGKLAEVPNVEATLENTMKQIKDWCETKETCVRFVEGYVRRAEKDGYLQTAVRELGEAWTTLDALAVLFNFQACIWQPNAQDERQMDFVGWVNRGGDSGDRETVHMWHDGDVHFDEMVIVGPNNII